MHFLERPSFTHEYLFLKHLDLQPLLVKLLTLFLHSLQQLCDALLLAIDSVLQIDFLKSNVRMHTCKSVSRDFSNISFSITRHFFHFLFTTDSP